MYIDLFPYSITMVASASVDRQDQANDMPDESIRTELILLTARDAKARRILEAPHVLKVHLRS